MGKAGILTEDERVELIEGEIIPMPPIRARHASGVDRTAYHFTIGTQGTAQVRVQSPVRLS